MKSLKQERDFKHKLATVLLWYSSTPHATTGVSLSELFLNRRIRTWLDLLHPGAEKRVFSRQTQQEKSPRKIAFREFAVGERVWAWNYRGTSKWVAGEIMEQLSPVSCKVIVSGGEWKRHADQLRNRVEDIMEQEHQNRTTTLPDVPFQADSEGGSPSSQSISTPATVTENGAQQEEEESTMTRQEEHMNKELSSQTKNISDDHRTQERHQTD